MAVLVREVRELPRYFVKLPFNPSSRDQVLKYLESQGHQAGRHRKTQRETVDADTIEKLARQTGDPVYEKLLLIRDYSKNKGTYIDGIIAVLGEDGRVHTLFTHRPSTLRFSSVSPNLQNIPDPESRLGRLIRSCFVARPGWRLIEVDLSGIEAVETGWFCRDPNYIRFAAYIHSLVTAHILNIPFSWEWSMGDMHAFSEEIKKKHKKTRDAVKRGVHLCLTGEHEVLTPRGWTRLDELQPGTEVAQWHMSGKIDFAVPSHITDEAYEGPMLSFEGRGLQVVMTPTHRVPYTTPGRRAFGVAQAQYLPRSARIPVCGRYDGPLAFTPEVALAVAAQADGSKGTYPAYHVFHFTKRRKIERMRSILAGVGARYTEGECYCHPGGRRFRVKYDLGLWLTPGGFNLPRLMELSLDGKKQFLDEVMLWDGSTHHNPKQNGHKRVSYGQVRRHAVLAFQTIAHLAGTQSLVRPRQSNQEGRSPFWVGSLNRRTLAREAVRREVHHSGRVYCVTVPTGFFLVRYKDTISVTGNTNYGGSPRMMNMAHPEVFTTIKAAEAVQEAYFVVAPRIRPWHWEVRERANDKKYLGGRDGSMWDHPFGYRHWFWSVFDYQRLRRSEHDAGRQDHFMLYGKPYRRTLGKDGKACVAFYPQSTTAGVVTEALLRLFDPEHESYIGEAGEGETPLRAQIHDSLLLEVPDAQVERVIAMVMRELTRPILQQPLPAEWGMGAHLTPMAEVKVGRNWARMRGVAA